MKSRTTFHLNLELILKIFARMNILKCITTFCWKVVRDKIWPLVKRTSGFSFYKTFDIFKSLTLNRKKYVPFLPSHSFYLH
ncbi:hypothetical protein C4546_04135 [Candidatus Parcubacteria bacterium]|nr:MAG: hypothetical protein C4546_04135 [Candidatus Parcubacteria bacterium]